MIPEEIEAILAEEIDDTYVTDFSDEEYWKQVEREYEETQREQAAKDAEHAQWQKAMPHYGLISAEGMFSVPYKEPDAYLDGLIYSGSLTILAGDPKAGKSTLLLHALDSMSRGAKFINRSTTRCSVLYASEQPFASLFAQVKRVPGLQKNKHIFFTPFEYNNVETKQIVDGKEKTVRTLPLTWVQQIDLWRKNIETVKANLLVIDTYSAFGQLQSGEAADAGVITTRLQQLKTLLSDHPGLAIVILHHLRKENNFGGNTRARNFSDIANSYALRAATDTNVVIFNPTGDDESPIRELKVESRFLEKPETFQVRLEGNAFTVVPQVVVDFPRTNDAAQDQIASAIATNPELNKLSNLKLAERLQVALRQVENYRKNHPKS